MKLRRSERIPVAQQRAFVKLLSAYLDRVGAPVPGDPYRYRVQTRHGPLGATIDRDGWLLATLFTKFDEPGAAKGTGCNPFSGKWNFHYNRGTFDRIGAAGIVADIARQIDPILERQEP